MLVRNTGFLPPHCVFPSIPTAMWVQDISWWVLGVVGRIFSQATGMSSQCIAMCQGMAKLYFIMHHIDFQIWSLSGNSSWNVDKPRSRIKLSLWQTTQWLKSTWGSLVSFAWKTSFMKLPSRARIFRRSQGSCALSISQWPVMLPRIEWASLRRWAYLAIEVNASISSYGSWTKPRISKSTMHWKHVFVFWNYYPVSSKKIIFCYSLRNWRGKSGKI